MDVVLPKAIILDEIDGEQILKKIEMCGRVAYKSEENITDDSARCFVGRIIQNGHESVLEHVSISVKFITDRGISHEIVRHRLASYTQESTRYCNYTGAKFGSEITVVMPCDISDALRNGNNTVVEKWHEAMRQTEKSYFKLIRNGCTPQTARSVLPTCLKTEIIMTANLREWRHFLKLRTAKNAHPDIQYIANDLLRKFKAKIPIIFDDIEGSTKQDEK